MNDILDITENQKLDQNKTENTYLKLNLSSQITEPSSFYISKTKQRTKLIEN